ncbi:MAG TPA: DNA primase, partial [Dehalococcoidia bacterium]|nr:DNA primase [Dehalococcoidia bacterium]
GQYVTLQKAGRTFRAPCPFHSERTPSFIVSPDRQSWHCFGACGTGGDVFSFVMKREGIEFPEALRLLAERAGVRLPERRVSEEQDKQRARLYSVNEAAAHFYRDLLLKGDAAAHARDYLDKRGLDSAAVQTFLLGYSPQGWEGLMDHLRKHAFTDREMLQAGLVIEGERGLHDRFRGRLMFAINDQKGRVIGFGARALDPSGEGPKYINTSQTALFDKGGVLYALDRAQAGIRREGRAVIVEGYMDCIAAHQHGFDNVIAQMGTALTERQVRIVKKLANEIVLALDADAAGSQAMVRGHEVVREALDGAEHAVPVISWRGLIGYQESAAVNLRIAVLPEGRDPDDVIRQDTDLWSQLIAEARPVLDFRLDAAAAAHDLTDPRGRSQFVQEFLPLLQTVTDLVVRAHYLQRLSRLSLLSEEELAALLRQTLARGKAREPVRPAASAAVTALPKGDAREEFLLGLLLRYPELRADGLEVRDDLLWESANRQILACWKQAGELEGVKRELPPELEPYLERLIVRKMPVFDIPQAREALLDCVMRLERRSLEAEKQAVSAQLATREEEVGSTALMNAALEESNDVIARELAELQLRDLETGLKLHGRERNDGRQAVGTDIDG